MVLEVGCGYGSNIRMVAHNRGDVKCYALDNSKEAIKLISKEPLISLLADCRATPFKGENFDLIFSAGLMEHFKDETPFLLEMMRILKTTGYLITFVPAKYSLWQLYRGLHFGRWKHGYEKAYKWEELRQVFTRNGFKVTKIVGIDPFSINGFLMKLLDRPLPLLIKRSFIGSGYMELGVIATPNLP
jgi:SAM-dependent methyltransferase